jgi:hypothetical protein
LIKDRIGRDARHLRDVVVRLLDAGRPFQKACRGMLVPRNRASATAGFDWLVEFLWPFHAKAKE